MPVNTNVTATATAPPAATAARRVDPRAPAAQRLGHGDGAERERHARHPHQVRRVRSLQRLGQDADADEGDGEQGDRAPGPAAVPAAQPDGEAEQPDGDDEHQEEPQEQRVRRRQVGHLPPRRDLLGDGLQAAVEVVPRRRAGQLAPVAQLEHGIEHHPLERLRRTGHHEVDPHRHQPDDAGEHERPAGVAVAPQHPAEHQADGDHEVGPVGQGQPGEQAGDDPCPPAARRRRGGRRGRRTRSTTA